jgi:hypothetical protein
VQVIARIAVLDEDISAVETEMESCALAPSTSAARRQSKTKKTQQKVETESDDDNDDVREADNEMHRKEAKSNTEDDYESESSDEEEQEEEQQEEQEEEEEEEEDTEYTPPASSLKHDKSKLSAVKVKVQKQLSRRSRLAFSPLRARQSSHNHPSHKARKQTVNVARQSSAPESTDENVDIETALLCSCKTLAYGDMVECTNMNVSAYHNCAWISTIFDFHYLPAALIYCCYCCCYCFPFFLLCAQCPYKWFHMGCVGLSAVPTGPWKCKTCSAAVS